MHPSVFAAAITDNSRIDDRLGVVWIDLISRKNDRAKLNSAVGRNGYGAAEIGPKRFERLTCFAAVMVRKGVRRDFLAGAAAYLFDQARREVQRIVFFSIADGFP